MKLIVKNIDVHIDLASKEEMNKIKEILSYIPMGVQYSYKFRSKSWTGLVSMIKKNIFPRGLLHLVEKEIHNLEIIHINEPQAHYEPINLKGIQLRDYQEKAVNAFKTHKYGIIRLSTRSGKTIIAIACTQALNKQTIFVVHTQDLLTQAYQEFKEKLNRKIGIIGSGIFAPEKFNIAMIQTLYNGVKKRDSKILNFLKTTEFVIWDECHHSSNMYQKVSNYLSNALWRLGLSATACITSKENALKTHAITGPIIYEIDMQNLIDDKRIIKPIVKFINLAYTAKLNIKSHNWHALYDKGIVENDIRNLAIAIIAVTEHKRNKSILILVEKIEHGKKLEKALNKKLNARFISGLDNIVNRISSLQELEKKDIDVLITTKIFNEGKDIPFLDVVIVAAGGKSPITLYQRYGRVLTITPFKTNAIIYDFTDLNHYKLAEHANKRRQIVTKNSAFDVDTISLSKI